MEILIHHLQDNSNITEVRNILKESHRVVTYRDENNARYVDFAQEVTIHVGGLTKRMKRLMDASEEKKIRDKAAEAAVSATIDFFNEITEDDVVTTSRDLRKRKEKKIRDKAFCF